MGYPRLGRQTVMRRISGLLLLLAVFCGAPAIAAAQETERDQTPRLAIGACESGGRVFGQLDYTAEHGGDRGGYSTASGAYQFLDGTWMAYGHGARTGTTHAADATPAEQDEAFWITFDQNGLSDWWAWSGVGCADRWINRDGSVRSSAPAVIVMAPPTPTPTPTPTPVFEVLLVPTPAPTATAVPTPRPTAVPVVVEEPIVPVRIVVEESTVGFWQVLIAVLVMAAVWGVIGRVVA